MLLLPKLDFGGNSYSTDQLPGKKITVSPRVGFNWDITGERKYVVWRYWRVCR